jgi:hypothetical protein
MAHFVIRRRRLLPGCFLIALSLGLSSNARAQGIGFQGGATVDPGQFFFGTHFETGELMPGFRFRPGIDGGFGGNSSLASINVEFLYNIPLHSGWSLYQGGGPAIVLVRQSLGAIHNTSVHAGTFITFGFAHENGFFTEFKLGGGSSQRLKFGVGYTIRKKTP